MLFSQMFAKVQIFENEGNLNIFFEQQVEKAVKRKNVPHLGGALSIWAKVV